MDYQTIIHTIENKRRFGSLPGVEVSGKLLAAVGSPQKDLAFIHIAGTNGKGSTAAFLCSILTAAGIKTGLFTSPHLIEFTERIQVNGVQISKEDAARLGQMLLHQKTDVNPAMFDYCLAMALLYFKEQHCSLVILETGLGGRLDSTNVIESPLVSIITKIGYDHTEVLGNTLAEIAGEKAGILKAGTRAVLESQKPEALAVLEGCCKERGIPYRVIHEKEIMPTASGFSYLGEMSYQMKMTGSFQRENALAAVFAAQELQKLGYPVTEDAMHQGIAEAFWNGRMEILCQEPFLMIDGAHNGNGVEALANSLNEQYAGEKFHFIMGVLADKDDQAMTEYILPLAARVTTVTPKSVRALEGEKLAAYIRGFGIEAENKDNLEEVIKTFFTDENKENSSCKTVAFGSLYFVGDIRKFVRQNLYPKGANITQSGACRRQE